VRARQEAALREALECIERHERYARSHDNDSDPWNALTLVQLDAEDTLDALSVILRAAVHDLP
jgi:hypothetical protein